MGHEQFYKMQFITITECEDNVMPSICFYWYVRNQVLFLLFYTSER